ncbi:mannose-1-phosphate guanylyltransferase [Anaerolineaceae bacterium]|nr:mannose-1-phosphate guanylyltransferase [Anaerolineaceae bacterium]
MAPKLYALILAGGSGTRLWPRSQPHMPKQFLDFTGAGSLLQLARQRLHPFIPAARTFVATHTDYRVLAHQQLRKVPAGNILGEPAARGTAAAIGLAALHIRRRDPLGVMAVLTADHLISKKREFQAALRTAAQLAADGWLVTLGIAPSRAETGYGYIQRGAALPARGAQRAYRVARFVEKPARDTAAKYAASGAYSWNSGMFIWRAERVLEEMALHMPELHAGLEQIGAALGQAHAARTLAKIWPLLPVETIDYGVMEKAARVAVLPVEIGWSDVGSWDVVYNLLPHDANGNAVSGQHYSPDTRNSLIYSGHRIVATLGLQDMVVVDTPTALLICPRERAQEVKLLAQMATHKRTADKPKKKTAKPAARKPALRAKTKPRKRA